MLVVPGLASMVANARLTTYRRVVCRFHYEAGLVPVRHHQRQGTVFSVGGKPGAAPRFPFERHRDRPVLRMNAHVSIAALQTDRAIHGGNLPPPRHSPDTAPPSGQPPRGLTPLP